MNIDSLDRKILEAYLRDSRISSRDVAKKLGVATGTVLARKARMEKEKIVKAYTVVLDNEKLGFELTVITEIAVSKGRLLEMEREIAKFPNVCAVYDTTGLTDAMVVAKFRNREELSNFTKTLLTLPFVERTNTHLVLTTVKEDFR
ncbi:MAG: Lrp/AsnC family transcriptional regulator, partial [Candidatus Bathyarchaeia archaeon]